jgi:hypothetical protein
MKAQSFQSTRCLIALNNIGCLLLEKNCHRQAYATFQEALELMKGSTEADAASQSGHLYRTRVHNAELRLSSPEVTYGTHAIEPLSYSLSPASLGYALGVDCKAGYHPLRIEVVEAEDATITTETLSCILLLNFAVSCRSVVMMSSARGSRSMDCVLRILTLTNLLLEQCDDNSVNSLLLLLVTLDTTKKALLEAGKYTEAEMLQFRLHSIRSYVSSTLSIFLAQQPAAGAA